MECNLLKNYRALQLKRWKILYITTEMKVCLVYIERVYISLQRDGCPDRSRCNVLISIQTDVDPGNEISVFHSFSPLA